MKLSKDNCDYIHNFIVNELKFLPNCNHASQFLPFALNKPFAVYDISNATDSQIESLYESMPSILASCLPQGHQLYAIDWFHNTILYDPKNIERTQGEENCTPHFNKDGIAFYLDFYPNGDYYFFLEKYGRFGYLSHPWRREVWIYGEPLLSEFEKHYKNFGFTLKSTIK